MFGYSRKFWADIWDLRPFTKQLGNLPLCISTVQFSCANQLSIAIQLSVCVSQLQQSQVPSCAKNAAVATSFASAFVAISKV